MTNTCFSMYPNFFPLIPLFSNASNSEFEIIYACTICIFLILSCVVKFKLLDFYSKSYIFYVYNLSAVLRDNSLGQFPGGALKIYFSVREGVQINLSIYIFKP